MAEFDLDNSLGFIINRTAAKLKRELQRSFEPYDVTPEQWVLLNRLWANDGIPQNQIADSTNKDQPNVTRIIDRLEEKGLVERRPDPNDRRAFGIFLTSKGRGLQDQLVSLASDLLGKALRGVSQDELSLVKILLNKIYENLG